MDITLTRAELELLREGLCRVKTGTDHDKRRLPALLAKLEALIACPPASDGAPPRGPVLVAAPSRGWWVHPAGGLGEA